MVFFTRHKALIEPQIVQLTPKFAYSRMGGIVHSADTNILFFLNYVENFY